MTTEAALREMSEKIGGLISSVDGLRRDSAVSEARSDQRTANLHRRLDDLVEEVGEMETKIERIGDRLAEVERDMQTDVMPVVREVTSWKQRGIGALAVVGIAGTALGASVVYFWHEIVTKLTRLS